MSSKSDTSCETPLPLHDNFSFLDASYSQASLHCLSHLHRIRIKSEVVVFMEDGGNNIYRILVVRDDKNYMESCWVHSFLRDHILVARNIFVHNECVHRDRYNMGVYNQQLAVF